MICHCILPSTGIFATNYYVSYSTVSDVMNISGDISDCVPQVKYCIIWNKERQMIFVFAVNSPAGNIYHYCKCLTTWWRHQMETFSALLALCAGNSPVACEFPSQRPVTRSFGVFFDLRLDKRLSKQSWGWWTETPSRSLWLHCDDNLRNPPSISQSQSHTQLYESWSEGQHPWGYYDKGIWLIEELLYDYMVVMVRILA